MSYIHFRRLVDLSPFHSKHRNRLQAASLPFVNHARPQHDEQRRGHRCRHRCRHWSSRFDRAAPQFSPFLPRCLVASRHGRETAHHVGREPDCGHRPTSEGTSNTATTRRLASAAASFDGPSDQPRSWMESCSDRRGLSSPSGIARTYSLERSNFSSGR